MKAEARSASTLVDLPIGKLERLPVLPMVVTRLLSLDARSDDYFDDVVDLVSHEPNYAARLLVAANSVGTRGYRTIQTMREAVIRLGAKQVSNLVVSLSVVRVFLPREDWERALWLHAIQVACGTRQLVRLAGDPMLDPEHGYLAGLLHDIGRFLLFDTVPEQLRQIDEADWESPEALVEAERRIVGIDHAALGALACARWGIPDSVAQIVRHHHSSRMSQKLGHATGRVGELVRVADTAMFGSLDHGVPPLSEEDDVEALARVRAALPPWFPASTPHLLTRLREAEAEAGEATALVGLGRAGPVTRK